MSENIEYSLNKLGKKHGGTFTYNPKKSDKQVMIERKDSLGISKTSHFSVMKDKILLPNDNNHMIAFKKCYDKVFKEFKDRLV